MKTLEEIALQVAKDAAMEISGASAAEMTPEAEAWSLAFARRLVAALGAQEPVGKVVTWAPTAGMFTVSQKHETNGFSDPFKYGAVYAAPVVNPDWQMVPKSQYAELIQCCEDMATGKGGWVWEDILDEHRAILTAPECGK